MTPRKSNSLERTLFMSYRIPLEGARRRAQEKIDHTWEDVRLGALVILELLLILALVSAIVFYLDPDVDILPLPWNFASFALLVVAVFWVYSFTAEFRDSVFQNQPAKRAS